MPSDPVDLLRTDAYKFSMAQAGYPLRRETFYLSFRRGGWQYQPFELEAEVRAMLPRLGDEAAAAAADFGARHGYGASDAMLRALEGELEILAVPAGTWVAPREPILTISGPSFLLSWLEPTLLRLHHGMQLATELLYGRFETPMARVVGDAHRELVERVCAAVEHAPLEIVDESAEYRGQVDARARELVDLLGDPARIFEVGMRAAVTEEQHAIALTALAEAGITMSSNLAQARALGLRPVGTMGHEHVQRWGADLAAFRAMRDMRIGQPSYLLDTFDTIRSGIPKAIAVMREQPHACSIRYDSGDKFAQYLYAHGEFRRAALEPVHILEDGLTAAMTAKFEQLRDFTGLPPARQLYGYGGHFVARTASNPLTRDRVAAVYKLSQSSGEPRMKFGNEAGIGKRSVPGCPVTWRRLRGQGPRSIIAQANEPVPEDYICLQTHPEARERLRLVKAEVGLTPPEPGEVPHRLSAATQSWVDALEQGRHAQI